MTPQPTGARAWLLTPPGVGAMAVIRLQSPDAADLVRQFFEPKRGAIPTPVPVDRLYYGWFTDVDERIDDGILVFHSITDSCDTADMTVHGGLRVVERMLMRLASLGAKIEQDSSDDFGARTIIEREVVRELVSAKTERAVRFLAAQRRLLPTALASIAETAERSPATARKELVRLQDRYQAARYLIDGATVAFCGPTNSGKSTLINACFGSGRSLTSPEAGTTLDWVDTTAAVDGVPLRVIDTAGVRAQAEDTERAAIERGRSQWRGADVCVVVLNAAMPPADSVRTEFGELLGKPNAVVAINKCDLPSAWDTNEFARAPRSARTSGLTGAGIGELVAHVVGVLSISADACEVPAAFTSRQVDGVTAILSDGRADRLPEAVRSLL